MKNLLHYFVPSVLMGQFSGKGYWYYIKSASERVLLKKNKTLENSLSGKKIYIVCNGPSVRDQDLLLLSGKTVFTVGAGYKHKGIDSLSPRYHFVPGVTLTDVFKEEDAISWFNEMDESLPGETCIVMSSQDAWMVRDYHLFKGREVFYMYMIFDWSESSKFDLTGPLPRVQSVPIMCMQFAIYCGVKEINILGAEHDSFKGQYTYAFDYTDHHPSVAGAKVLVEQSHSFLENHILFKQYEFLRDYCRKKGVDVFNLTNGGVLNVFPRKEYPND